MPSIAGRNAAYTDEAAKQPEHDCPVSHQEEQVGRHDYLRAQRRYFFRVCGMAAMSCNRGTNALSNGVRVTLVSLCTPSASAAGSIRC